MNEILKEIDKFERDNSVVKVFGAIIYSDRHPHITMVLDNDYYWRSLNEISGQRWAIFATRAIKGHLEIKGGSEHHGALSFMIKVWVEPSENKNLIKLLEIESTEDPVFVCFTRLKTGMILRSILSLDDSSVENAYERLKKIVSDLTYAVERIDTENIEDYESVFNAVDMTVRHIHDWDIVRNVFTLYQWLKKIKP